MCVRRIAMVIRTIWHLVKNGLGGEGAHEHIPSEAQQECGRSIRTFMIAFMEHAATKKGTLFGMPDRRVPFEVQFFEGQNFVDWVRDTDETLGGAAQFALTSDIVRVEQEEYEDWEEDFGKQQRGEPAEDIERAKKARLEERAKRPMMEPKKLCEIFTERGLLKKVDIVGQETRNYGTTKEQTTTKLMCQKEDTGISFEPEQLYCSVFQKPGPRPDFWMIEKMFLFMRTIFLLMLSYMGAVVLTRELWDLDLNCLILGGTEEMCGWGDKGRNRIRCGGWDFKCQMKEIRRRLEETQPGEEL